MLAPDRGRVGRGREGPEYLGRVDGGRGACGGRQHRPGCLRQLPQVSSYNTRKRLTVGSGFKIIAQPSAKPSLGMPYFQIQRSLIPPSSYVTNNVEFYQTIHIIPVFNKIPKTQTPPLQIVSAKAKKGNYRYRPYLLNK